MPEIYLLVAIPLKRVAVRLGLSSAGKYNTVSKQSGGGGAGGEGGGSVPPSPPKNFGLPPNFVDRNFFVT